MLFDITIIRKWPVSFGADLLVFVLNWWLTWLPRYNNHINRTVGPGRVKYFCVYFLTCGECEFFYVYFLTCCDCLGDRGLCCISLFRGKTSLGLVRENFLIEGNCFICWHFVHCPQRADRARSDKAKQFSSCTCKKKQKKTSCKKLSHAKKKLPHSDCS